MPSLRDLPKKYPELFKGEDYHFECSDGWYHLLDTLLGHIKHALGRHREVQGIKQSLLDKGEDLAKYQWIEDYFKENPEDPLKTFSLDQIKEKFGGLRFYWSCDISSPEVTAVSGAISLAESLSYCFCEVCGNNTGIETRPSEGKNWIRTLCREHRQEEEKKATEKPSTNQCQHRNFLGQCPQGCQ